MGWALGTSMNLISIIKSHHNIITIKVYSASVENDHNVFCTNFACQTNFDTPEFITMTIDPRDASRHQSQNFTQEGWVSSSKVLK